MMRKLCIMFNYIPHTTPSILLMYLYMYICFVDIFLFIACKDQILMCLTADDSCNRLAACKFKHSRYPPIMMRCKGSKTIGGKNNATHSLDFVTFMSMLK